ncbi:MAG: hypothetical protein V3W41_14090 [Planctomycetota bacterium]
MRSAHAKQRSLRCSLQSHARIALASLFFFGFLNCTTAQDEQILKGLASAKTETVSRALQQVKGVHFGIETYVAPLLRLAASNEKQLSRPAFTILQDWSLRIKEPLLIACLGKARQEAIIAIKLLARTKDKSLAKRLYPLLDHLDAKTAAEATKAVFDLGSDKTDEFMLARLSHLKTPAPNESPKAPRPRHYINALYYCGNRPLKEAFPYLCEGFQSQDATLARVSSFLLKKHYRERFESLSRKSLESASGERLFRMLDFILDHDSTHDRTLGLSHLPIGELKSLLTEISKHNQIWCSPMPMTATLKNLRAILSIQNLRSKKERSLTLGPQGRLPWAEFCRGISFDLPIFDVLRRPYRYTITIERKPNSLTLLCKNLESRPPKGVIGIGNAVMGVWYGRETWLGSDIRIRFDKDLRPVETKLVDSKDQDTLTVNYIKWLQSPSGRVAPQAIQVESQRIVIRSSFTWGPEEIWFFERARTAMKQAAPGGKIELQAIATGNYQVIEAAKKPTQSEVEFKDKRGS